jgi:hypothetical protein
MNDKKILINHSYLPSIPAPTMELTKLNVASNTVLPDDNGDDTLSITVISESEETVRYLYNKPTVNK